MNKKHLYQPLMCRLPNYGHDNRFAVDSKSRELLLEIRNLLDVFAPIGDDFLHGLWIEVSRGKPSDWASFKEAKDGDEDINTKEDYLKRWQEEFPRENYWYFLSVNQYRGHTYLHITDRDSRWCIIHDDPEWDYHNIGPLNWYLKPLLAFLKEKVDEIVKDSAAYNRYVEEHLPKRQRTGSIPRKDMNRIVSWQRRVPKQLEKGMQVLRECIANEEIYNKIAKGENPGELPPFYREPLDTMSIRIYSKYYRVAHETFESQHESFWSEGEKKWHEQRQKERIEMDDVTYYRKTQFGRHGKITDETDFDSVKAFEDIAFDHYGELGLSRMDIHATDYYTPRKWLITFRFSYSAYIDDAVDIAVALYESGCPLLIHDARKTLDVLEEKDNVLLTPHIFHDYFCHHEEGSVFDLPYECYLDQENELTREQYDEIVSLACWEPEVQVVLDTFVPLDSPAYNLIREEVQKPLTVCGILAALQRTHDIVYGIHKKGGQYHCYLIEHGEKQITIDDHTSLFPTDNEAVLDAIIRYVQIKQKQQT